MKRFRLIIPGLLIIVLMLMLAVFNGIGMAQQRSHNNYSMIRVIHASPGSPPVDVYVDGKVVLRNQRYRNTSHYLNLPPGAHNIRIVPAGKGPRVNALVTRTVSVRPNERYSLMTVGNRMQLYPVAGVHEVVSNICKLRFVHASSDTPPVDVAVRGGRVLFRNVSFGNSSGYVDINPAAVNLEIREAGTKRVLLNVSNVRMRANNVYSLNLMGLSKGRPGLEASLTVDSNMQPSSMPRSGMGGASTE